MDPATSDRIRIQIVQAILSRNVARFHRIVDGNPFYPDDDSSLCYAHEMSVNSLEMFRAFVERFPQTKHWDFGPTGNVVGIAALLGNVVLLKYAIEELGHKASEGRVKYSPVSYSSAPSR